LGRGDAPKGKEEDDLFQKTTSHGRARPKKSADNGVNDRGENSSALKKNGYEGDGGDVTKLSSTRLLGIEEEKKRSPSRLDQKKREGLGRNAETPRSASQRS